MCDVKCNGIGCCTRDKTQQTISLCLLHFKTLNTSQCNHIVTEQELLSNAQVFENFRAYLLGTKVFVHTDHVVLRFLKAKRIPR